MWTPPDEQLGRRVGCGGSSSGVWMLFPDSALRWVGLPCFSWGLAARTERPSCVARGGRLEHPRPLLSADLPYFSLSEHILGTTTWM